MFYDTLKECSHHDEVMARISNLEYHINLVHNDLKVIKYLLVVILCSMLGVEVVL